MNRSRYGRGNNYRRRRGARDFGWSLGRGGTIAHSFGAIDGGLRRVAPARHPEEPALRRASFCNYVKDAGGRINVAA